MITSFEGDFMEAIKEAYGEATMHKIMEVIGEDGMLKEKRPKIELPKFFIHSGKAIDIPSGWNIVKTGKILKDDRAYAGSAESGEFMSKNQTASLIGCTVKDRICIISRIPASNRFLIVVGTSAAAICDGDGHRLDISADITGIIVGQ